MSLRFVERIAVPLAGPDFRPDTYLVRFDSLLSVDWRRLLRPHFAKPLTPPDDLWLQVVNAGENNDDRLVILAECGGWQPLQSLVPHPKPNARDMRGWQGIRASSYEMDFDKFQEVYADWQMLIGNDFSEHVDIAAPFVGHPDPRPDYEQVKTGIETTIRQRFDGKNPDLGVPVWGLTANNATPEPKLNPDRNPNPRFFSLGPVTATNDAVAWLQLVQAMSRDADIRACDHCGRFFELGGAAGARKSKKFCGEKCRQAAFRALKKAGNHAQHAAKRPKNTGTVL